MHGLLYAKIQKIYIILSTLGGVMVSTLVTKPDVHAEDAAHLVNNAVKYSCQTRQLRTSCLNPASRLNTACLWVCQRRH